MSKLSAWFIRSSGIGRHLLKYAMMTDAIVNKPVAKNDAKTFPKLTD